MSAAQDNLAAALAEPELLAPRMRWLVETVGIVAALELVKRFGGTRFYVPIKVEPDHWLTKLIGPAPAERLINAVAARESANQIIEIDKCDDAMREIRNRRIRAEAAAGRQAHLQAIDYDLTERQVWTIRAGGDTLDDKQSPLFS